MVLLIYINLRVPLTLCACILFKVSFAFSLNTPLEELTFSKFLQLRFSNLPKHAVSYKADSQHFALEIVGMINVQTE